MRGACGARLRRRLRRGPPICEAGHGRPQQDRVGAVESWQQLSRVALPLFGAGAVLGPLLDGQHSSHNVLHYAHPQARKVPCPAPRVSLARYMVSIQVLSIGTCFHLETCWWVPLLFGVAAVILGLSHPLLDRTRIFEGFGTLDSMFASSPMGGKAPSWLFVNGDYDHCLTPLQSPLPSYHRAPLDLPHDSGVASFAWQYAMSGILEEASGGSDPSLGACLFLFAAAQWTMYDHTKGGLLMATLCAFAGPLLEIVLINVGGLYSYTHPGILGIPLWIPWVYFAGAPAVGNLGRRVLHIIERKYELSIEG
eukprot:SM000041S15534  [mRNA]  locus=s41:652036:654112:- [translate_table: standard]